MPEDSDFEKEKIERLRRAMYSRKVADSMGIRPRHELAEAPQLVDEAWHEPEQPLSGVIAAPRFIGATRTVLWWALGASVAFFIVAIGFFIYYFTFGGGANPASPSNIQIGINGPAEIQGGEPTELQIAVTNSNRIALQLADLVVTFPDGTRSVTDYKTALPSLRQSLGTIEPGGVRQGTISAVFAGSKGDRKPVKVELQYHEAGSNAVFVASQEYTLVFGSSPVTLSVDGNAETVSGQPVQFTVNVSSNTNAPLKAVQLGVDYPFGFKFSSADPAPTASGLWNLGDFAPGQQKSVTILGTLAGEQGDTRIFHLSADAAPDASTSQAVALAENTYSMHIAEPFLGLSIQVNRSETPSAVAKPGGTVTVTIKYKNNLSSEITNAVIAAQLSGTPLDGSRVAAVNGFYRSTDTTVIWDRTTNPSLASIKPGQEGSVEFTFQVPTADALKGITNPRVDISVNAAGRRLSEAGVPQTLQSTADQRIKFASTVQLIAQGVYYSNPFGASGPIPPKAGTETAYALVITLMNTTNQITDAKVTMTLPPYVRWTGSHAPRGEDFSYDQNTGTLTWDVGTLDPGTGVDGTQARQIAFSLGLTPSTSQVGEKPAIVQNVVFTGVDASTGETVSATSTPDVTTNLAQPGRSSSDIQTATDPGFTSKDAFVTQ